MDWGIFGLRSYWYILQLLQMIRDGETLSPDVILMVWITAAYIVPCFFWIPHIKANKGLFCILETLLAGSLSVYHIILMGETSNFILIPILSVGYLFSKNLILIAPIILGHPVILAAFQFINYKQAIGFTADMLLFLCIGLWVGVIANAYRRNNELLTEIADQNRLLKQYAVHIEKMTLLEERERMSKELHDTLGHSYISFSLALDAAILLLDKNPQLAKEKLLRLRDLTELNIHKMRNLVHEMGSGEDINLEEQVVEIIHSFQEYTGTQIDYQVSGTEQLLRVSMRQAIIRMIQESCTNAVKHGKASQIEINIHYHPARVQVVIRDNGLGINDIVFGFGLSSMKKRIESLDGALVIFSAIGRGTEVRCDIPIKGDHGYEVAHR